MTQKEKINRNFALALEFTKAIFDNPALLNKIPNGAVIEFLENDSNPEKKKTPLQNNSQKVKYVKVKPAFEIV